MEYTSLRKFLEAKLIQLEMVKEEAALSGKNFKGPSYIVQATLLPTGAIELAVNDKFILDKIRYILEAYDDNLYLKTNKNIRIINIMIV